ncbi:MAG: CUB domain-containing protein [Saprospiraceae bacterium]
MKKITLLFFALGIFISSNAQITHGTGTSTVTDGTSTQYTDSGGSGADYSNNESNEMKICPTDGANYYISITFDTWDVENGTFCNNDYISYTQNPVADGDASASNYDDYWCNNAPPTLTSTSSDGCISLYFYSDGSTTEFGWTATVTSVARPAEPADMCSAPNPLCGSALGQQYSANTTGTAEAGNDYGCLSQQPRPSWFYFEAAGPGNVELEINNTVDLDFALWGPFSDLATATAACGSLAAPVDCSYSAITSPEVANYNGAATGDVFLLLVTAYSATPTTFTITEGSGNTAPTNCSILDPCAASSTMTWD